MYQQTFPVFKVDISWSTVESISGIYDYEVGMATTANSPAPDIMPFQSTKQNPNIRYKHMDLPTGATFYITIKTVTKSGAANIQVSNTVYKENVRPVVHSIV